MQKCRRLKVKIFLGKISLRLLMIYCYVAEEYVKLLMTKGAETPCEENGKIEIEMPVWADEERMKRSVFEIQIRFSVFYFFQSRLMSNCSHILR